MGPALGVYRAACLPLDVVVAHRLSGVDRIRDLLLQVYEVFAQEHLLALQPPSVLLELQNWYFTEFERQGNGEEPIPWTGPTSMPPG